jgi:hypothetical protein
MMKRDQAKAGEDDPTAEEEALEIDGTKTDQLDDTYRLRIVSASESRDGDQSGPARAYARYPATAAETLSLEDRWREADAALDAALARFKFAAAAVMERIKAGEHLPKVELDREWNARLHLIEARQLAERLGRLRKTLAPPNK